MTRLIALLAVIAILSSCKSHERLVAATTSDTVYITKYSHDSIHITDSVYVREYMRGDTVYITKDRWRTQYKDKIINDTVYVSNKEYVTIKEKEPIPLWKEILIYYSAFVIVALLAIIVVLFLYTRYLLREKEEISL